MHADRSPSSTSPIHDGSADAYTGSDTDSVDADGSLGLSAQMHRSSGSFELVLSAVVLGLVGLWIDGRVGTTPIFTIVLTVAGFLGAGASLYYRYKYEISRLQAETTELRSGSTTQSSSKSSSAQSTSVQSSSPRAARP